MIRNDKDKLYREAILQDIEDAVTFPSPSFWIPFSTTSDFNEWEVPSLVIDHNEFSHLRFNALPTILTLCVTLIKIILSADVSVASRFILSLFSFKDQIRRRQSLCNLLCEITGLKNILGDAALLGKHLGYGVSLFSAKTKIEVLQQLLAAETVNVRLPPVNIPRWKGKPMEFIEFISIGIEMELFEGESQNQICNNLIKGFQVDAEDEAPIYKQRFDAMFRRSKKQLPLLSAYVRAVEAKKGMKLSDFS